MDWESVWRVAVALTLVCQAVLNFVQWKLNRLQGQFNREVVQMLAALRENRELRDALAQWRTADTRDAGRGLREG